MNIGFSIRTSTFIKGQANCQGDFSLDKQYKSFYVKACIEDFNLHFEQVYDVHDCNKSIL